MSTEYADRSGNSFDDSDGGSSYDNIEPWLAKLASLTCGSDEHGRLRDEIISRCLPLGEHVARRYTGRGVEYEDLAQIAAVGVVLSVDRFDSSNGSAFLAFAIPTIMGEIKRYFRDSTWAVRVPRRIKDIQQNLAASISELSQQSGRAPTARQLAAHLNVDLAEVTQALIANNCYRTDSLDTGGRILGGDSEQATAPVDRLAAEEPGYQLVEDTLTAGPLLAGLPERQRRILVLRFGENKTQTEIAEEIGVSQMQVSRLLSRTLADLRNRALHPRKVLRAA